jgi:hypothetical protein
MELVTYYLFHTVPKIVIIGGFCFISITNAALAKATDDKFEMCTADIRWNKLRT